jgi:ribosomal protein L12E/L44/L45/RPP1/RPP2
MARKRDPNELLERARQMEEEARRIRGEADRIRKEREAKEDRKAGALLRRLWKSGWTGVDLRDVVEAAAEIFCEAPATPAAAPRSKEPDGAPNSAHSEPERDSCERSAEVAGGLFAGRGGQTNGGA